MPKKPGRKRKPGRPKGSRSAPYKRILKRWGDDWCRATTLLLPKTVFEILAPVAAAEGVTSSPAQVGLWACCKMAELVRQANPATAAPVETHNIKQADWPEIYQRRVNGETYAEIGMDFGVSRQRIHQICDWVAEHGMPEETKHEPSECT